MNITNENGLNCSTTKLQEVTKLQQRTKQGAKIVKNTFARENRIEQRDKIVQKLFLTEDKKFTSYNIAQTVNFTCLTVLHIGSISHKITLTVNVVYSKFLSYVYLLKK